MGTGVVAVRHIFTSLRVIMIIQKRAQVPKLQTKIGSSPERMILFWTIHKLIPHPQCSPRNFGILPKCHHSALYGIEEGGEGNVDKGSYVYIGY